MRKYDKTFSIPKTEPVKSMSIYAVFVCGKMTDLFINSSSEPSVSMTTFGGKNTEQELRAAFYKAKKEILKQGGHGNANMYSPTVMNTEYKSIIREGRQIVDKHFFVEQAKIGVRNEFLWPLNCSRI